MHAMSSGENEIPSTVVQRSFYYSGQRINEHIDVTIILGRFHDQPHDVQLLLMRFHGKEFTNDVSASVSSSFYRDISKIISKNHGGFVCHRFGGSSGLWNKANDDLLKFLHHPGNFPRKAMVSLCNCWSSMLRIHISMLMSGLLKRGSKLFPWEPR